MVVKVTEPTCPEWVCQGFHGQLFSAPFHEINLFTSCSLVSLENLCVHMYFLCFWYFFVPVPGYLLSSNQWTITSQKKTSGT